MEESTLNAYLDISPDLTLNQAKQADALIAKGNFGVLTGIPIAHKDVFVSPRLEIDRSF
jgi:aspartyl-tRNA(Asn)/glutamyl-tRNA(Gln) amidotransferase subunit A